MTGRKRDSSWKQRLAVAASLGAVVAVVYGITLTHGFAWDDHEQILNNPYLRDWSSVRELFTKDVLEITRHEEGDIHSNYYRPLFFLQYLVYYQLFELSDPLWHFAAILQHFFACLAAYWFARCLDMSAIVAWWAAVLFALHPVHGESVGWLAASFNDPPVATLTFIGLALYVTHIESRRSTLMIGALIAYLVALGHKESALGMLLLVPLTDWYANPARRWSQRIKSWSPFLAVTVVYFVIRSLAIGFAFGENPNAKPIVETLATFPMLVVYYARFLLWPFGMGPSYPLRYVDVWSDARAWAILLVIVIAAVGIWHFTRRDRLARFGLLWIVFTVWPVFNVRAFRETYLVHQRYLYLAVFGLCLFVAGVILSRWGNKTRSHIALGMTAVIYALATMLHIGAWSSDRALYLRIAELDPANVAAWGWLGHDAREKGNTQEAREFLNTAITNDPMHGYAHRELGIMDLKSARMNSAIAHLRQAVAWYEDQPQSRHLLIECRENLAGALASVGRMGEALTLSQLHAGPPDYSPQSAINAALLLMQQSNWDQAERILSQATEKNESNDRILETLAGLYLQTGRPEKARALAQKAVSINSQTVWAQEILQAR